MSSNRYDFNITAGTSFITYLNVLNTDGTYIDLNGYGARGYVRNSYYDTGVIFNLNPSPIEPIANGTIMVSGSASNTYNLPAGSFLYDIEIYNNNGYALKVLEGDFNINPSTSINYATNSMFTGTDNGNGQISTGVIVVYDGPHLTIGSGSPEGVVADRPGSIYTDSFNGTLYQKITGLGVNGWI